MPKVPAPPPPLPCDRLKFAAKIDFVTVVIGRNPPMPPTFDGTPELIRPKKGAVLWELTVHDPSRNDLERIVNVYDNPMVMGIEIAVDLAPKDSTGAASRQALLIETFKAVAGRFRPEDQALWGYGSRGGVSAKNGLVQPLERRQAQTSEQIIYGNKRGFMQAKLYLKTRDQNADLPLEEHVVRMELSMRRGACMDERLGLDRAQDLLDYAYRATFTKHFRIIKAPALRNTRRLTPEEIARREKRMLRAWATAGVAKFPVGDDLPEDTCHNDERMIAKRQWAQLPHGYYKLLRDQVANAKIGSALMNLQRRMRA